MELSEFARHVLFSPCIEDKLYSPELFTDEKPGSSLQGAMAPARTKGLRLSDWHTRQKVAFPSGSALENTRERGKALHFFANHELLALELMALVLLRFPNADSAFRLGIARTMLEEQGHFRLYIHEMHSRGVEFGEIPVNDFFWNLLSQVKSPAQFAAGMSLTFEQANLDFALHYQQLFSQVGDKTAAAVMQRVFEDEIRHVSHGVKWLRVFGGGDGPIEQWENYLANLPEGLSPARAKGIVFAEDARRKAGLCDQYIHNLKVFSQSKGRPPRLWLFTPTVEMDWASGDTLAAKNLLPAAVTQLIGDLDVAAGLLASSDDIVVVAKPPSSRFKTTLQEAGFRLPEYLTLSDLQQPGFATRKLGAMRPWGWSEQILQGLSSLAAQCSVVAEVPCEKLFKVTISLANKSKVARWEEAAWSQFKETNSQQLVDILMHLSGRNSGNYNYQGQGVHSHAELETAIAGNRTTSRWLLKAPHSSAGRERREFSSASLSDISVASVWAEKWFSKGEALQLEPKLIRLDDFSVQLHIEAGGQVRCVGVTRFLTSGGGRYFGTLLGKRRIGLTNETLRTLSEPFSRTEGLNLTFWEAASKWAIALGEVAAKEGFRGPIGIDMMLYRTEGQEAPILWRPLVEINPRYTMGRVALKLEPRISPSSYAVWLQLSKREIGCSPAEFAERVEKLFPQVFERNGVAVLREGHLFTNDPLQASRFVSCLFCATSEDQLGKNLSQLIAPEMLPFLQSKKLCSNG